MKIRKIYALSLITANCDGERCVIWQHSMYDTPYDTCNIHHAVEILKNLKPNLSKFVNLDKAGIRKLLEKGYVHLGEFGAGNDFYWTLGEGLSIDRKLYMEVEIGELGERAF